MGVKRFNCLFNRAHLAASSDKESTDPLKSALVQYLFGVDFTGIIFGGCCCGAPTLLCIFLIVDSLRSARRLDAAMDSIREEEAQMIRQLIKEAASEQPTAAVLVATDQKAENAGWLIQIPRWLNDFPWAGRAIRFEAGEFGDLRFEFVEYTSELTTLRGWLFRPEPVPRTKLKSGKLQNIYSADRLLGRSPELKKILRAKFPENPARLLRQFFDYNSEGPRIGGSPSWAQGPELVKCPLCKSSMSLLVQFSDVGWNADEIVYLWGCKRHPEETAATYQLY